MMRWLTVGTVVLATASVVGCAVNPATGEREFSLMSEEQEIAIGRQSDEQVRREMGVYDVPELQEYVASIGLRLAQVSERPGLPWHFAVVDSPVVNAFALPGGYIYLTRGILAVLNDEAELAGVLGHEIGHVTARHAASQYSRATGAQLGLVLGSILVPEVRPLEGLAGSALGVLFLKYGRDDELQADELGTRYASRGGWNPAGVAGMLNTLDRISDAEDSRGVPDWLSTHPAPDNRVRNVQDAIRVAAAERPDSTATNRQELLRHIDGIVYGDNPDQGIVRGSRFLHGPLRFSVDFPEGWEVVNSPVQVVAKQPGANVFLLLEAVQRRSGRTLEDTALQDMNAAGFRAIGAGPTQINGLEAFVGTYQGSTQDLGRVRLRVGHILHDRSLYRLAGITPEQLFQSVEETFTSSIRSFRPLTTEEAGKIRPNRVQLYTVRRGDTWELIAKQSQGVIAPERLAIMNGHSVADQPEAGEQVKIVVAG